MATDGWFGGCLFFFCLLLLLLFVTDGWFVGCLFIFCLLLVLLFSVYCLSFVLCFLWSMPYMLRTQYMSVL